jgi:Myb-like DNA-binding domain
MKQSKRNAEDCKDRIEKIQLNTTKGTWTPEEDASILRWYAKYGRNWALIAKHVEGHNGK